MANNVWKNLSSCWLPRLIALRSRLFHKGNGKPVKRGNSLSYIIVHHKGPLLKVYMSRTALDSGFRGAIQIIVNIVLLTQTLKFRNATLLVAGDI